MPDFRYVTRRGERYYWQRRGFPLWRLPDNAEDRERIVSDLNYTADHIKKHGVPPKKRRRFAVPKRSSYWEIQYARIAAAAKRRSLVFDLSYDDLMAIVERAGGRCEVTGIPFTLAGNGRLRPYRPSLDRIDSALGYTVGNCRLVCLAVNVALGQWGDEVLKRIARGIVFGEAAVAEPNGAKNCNAAPGKH